MIEVFYFGFFDSWIIFPTLSVYSFSFLLRILLSSSVSFARSIGIIDKNSRILKIWVKELVEIKFMRGLRLINGRLNRIIIGDIVPNA